jgi:hypothetical protein
MSVFVYVSLWLNFPVAESFGYTKFYSEILTTDNFGIRWEDDDEVKIKEIICESRYWIQLAQDTVFGGLL